MKLAYCRGTDLQSISKAPWYHICFQGAFFSVLETNEMKVPGATSGLYGEWDNNCNLKEFIGSNVDKAV